MGRLLRWIWRWAQLSGPRASADADSRQTPGIEVGLVTTPQGTHPATWPPTESRPQERPDPAPFAPPVPTPPGEPAWLRVARGELQVAEVPGPIHNPRILEYLQAADDLTPELQAQEETAWCSAFVNWCFQQAGHAGTRSAAARSWLRWGTTLAAPRLGCIVVLSRGASSWQGHVGFYVGTAGPQHLLLLGGNQSNEVNISAYPSTRVLSYRWPSGGG